MHFPANARLIFLTDELTHDRYLVDIGATLSIVPCTSKTNPSGPLLKGRMDNQSPRGDLLKLSNSMANFILHNFCKPLWQVPFWALTSSESSKSLLPETSQILLLALQRLCPPPTLFCPVLTVLFHACFAVLWHHSTCHCIARSSSSGEGDQF
jgi:hypothetical protein